MADSTAGPQMAAEQAWQHAWRCKGRGQPSLPPITPIAMLYLHNMKCLYVENGSSGYRSQALGARAKHCHAHMPTYATRTIMHSEPPASAATQCLDCMDCHVMHDGDPHPREKPVMRSSGSYSRFMGRPMHTCGGRVNRLLIAGQQTRQVGRSSPSTVAQPQAHTPTRASLTMPAPTTARKMGDRIQAATSDEKEPVGQLSRQGANGRVSAHPHQQEEG